MWLLVKARAPATARRRGALRATREPPQGWLPTRPAGAGSPAVVARADGALRCAACEKMLAPPFASRAVVRRRGVRAGRDRGELVPGDSVLVAATLERARVTRVAGRAGDGAAAAGDEAGGRRRNRDGVTWVAGSARPSIPFITLSSIF